MVGRIGRLVWYCALAAAAFASWYALIHLYGDLQAYIEAVDHLALK